MGSLPKPSEAGSVGRRRGKGAEWMPGACAGRNGADFAPTTFHVKHTGRGYPSQLTRSRQAARGS